MNGHIQVSIQLLFLFNSWKIDYRRMNKVSIQLLFLFNNKDNSQSPVDARFNTASVLIQPNRTKWQEGKKLFQYSFCSYSTIYLQINSLPMISFNTASVLIQHGDHWLLAHIKKFQYSFCSYSTINFTAIIIYRIY